MLLLCSLKQATPSATLSLMPKYSNAIKILPLLMMFSMATLTGCSALEGLKDGAQNLFGSVLGLENSSEPPAELIEYKPEIGIDVLWKEQVGVGKNKQSLKLNVALNADKLFVADREGLIQARASDSGKLLWEANTDYPFSAGPGLGSGTLILGSSDARVVALDESSGNVLWRASVSSEVLAIPVVAQGLVILRTTDGAVIALDEKTGQQRWIFQESVPALTLRGLSKPLVVKDRLIIGFASGKLLALQLETGKNLWEATVAVPSGRSEVERLVDLSTDPIEIEGMVFISSYHGGTSAAVAADGNMLWRNEHLSSASGLSSDWRYLYVSDIESDVWQIDQRNGSTLWKQHDLHYRSLSAPLAYEEYVVVGDFEGYLHWLSRSDGRQLARIKIAEAGIDSKPVVANDVIYIYSKDGTLAALKAKAM